MNESQNLWMDYTEAMERQKRRYTWPMSSPGGRYVAGVDPAVFGLLQKPRIVVFREHRSGVWEDVTIRKTIKDILEHGYWKRVETMDNN